MWFCLFLCFLFLRQTSSTSCYKFFTPYMNISHYWWDIQVNTDGSILAAVPDSYPSIFTSTNGGEYWSEIKIKYAVRFVAMSDNGLTMLAGDTQNNKYLLMAKDGTTFSQLTALGTKTWIGAIVSTDGMIMVAIASSAAGYVSTDGGSNWLQRSSNMGMYGPSYIASSYNCSKLYTNTGYSEIYLSTDYGVSSTSRYSPSVRSLVSSSDGIKLVVIDCCGLSTSTNYGTSWTTRGVSAGLSSSRRPLQLTASGDGSKIAFLDQNTSVSNLFVSTNGGATFLRQSIPYSSLWQVIKYSRDGSLLASAKKGYTITTSTDNGVTWSLRTVGGSSTFASIAGSEDLSKLIITTSSGYYYLSVDGGYTWVEKYNSIMTSGAWVNASSSRDGNTMVIYEYGGYMKVSIDSGNFFKTVSSTGNWRAVALSHNGSIIYGVAYNGFVYVSTNNGTTFTQRDSIARKWLTITCNRDGSRVIGGLESGSLYYSFNRGVSWSATVTSGLSLMTWNSVIMSDSGAIAYAVAKSSNVYISNSYGQSWSVLSGSPIQTWKAVVCNADGSIVAAALVFGSIFLSTDTGVSWSKINPTDSSQVWSGLTINSDGSKVVGAVYYGLIHVWTPDLSCAPSSQPTGQPSRQPFCRPTGQPSRQPTSQPTRQPMGCPTGQPSRQPAGIPTSQPSCQPSDRPSGQPLSLPTTQPSSQPSRSPTIEPSQNPTASPSNQPSRKPSSQPSDQPSSQPTVQPLTFPTSQPSSQPTEQPQSNPSSRPSSQPIDQPSGQPTTCPSSHPSSQPTVQPLTFPTIQPSSQPTEQPQSKPSSRPSSQPIDQPSSQPSSYPTTQPSSQPTSGPTCVPSMQPSSQPSTQPTHPTAYPSTQPSMQPSSQPSGCPSCSPTMNPTNQPTSLPTSIPSQQPDSCPSAFPTNEPTLQPISFPSHRPTNLPSEQPSTQPSSSPSIIPSSQPITAPSTSPSSQPFSQPSAKPVVSTHIPSSQPSLRLSEFTTNSPLFQSTLHPSSCPSSVSVCPSMQLTSIPLPSIGPLESSYPTSQPVLLSPNESPTFSPSSYSISSSAPISTATSMVPSILPTVTIAPSPFPLPGSVLQNLVTFNANFGEQQQHSNVTKVIDIVSNVTTNALQSLLSLTDIPTVATMQVSTDLVKATLSLFSPSYLSELKNASVPTNHTTETVFLPAISLPDSSSTVNIGIPSLGESVALYASVVKYNASLFNNPQSDINNASDIPSASKLVSDIVNVAVLLVRNDSSTKLVLPKFSATLSITSDSSWAVESIPVLHHNCSWHVVETVSLYCVQAQVSLNLTCNGLGQANVRQKCPVPKQSCNVVNLRTGRIVDSDYCVVGTSSAGSITCNCGMTSANDTAANQLLSALSGSVTVAAFSSYVTGQLDATVTSTASLQGFVDSRSIIIMVTFGCLWVFVFAICVISYWGNTSMKRENVSDTVLRDISMQRNISMWMEKSWLKRTVNAMLQHHRVVGIFRRVSDILWVKVTKKPVDEQSLLSHEDLLFGSITWLTSFTVTCFILSFLYDWQYPADDSGCRIYTTKDSCLEGTSMFDPSQAKCSWHAASSDALYAGELMQWKAGTIIRRASISPNSYTAAFCTLNSSQSLIAFLLSFIVGSLVSAAVSLLLEYCSNVLLSTQQGFKSDRTKKILPTKDATIMCESKVEDRIEQVQNWNIEKLRSVIVKLYGVSYGALFEMVLLVVGENDKTDHRTKSHMSKVIQQLEIVFSVLFFVSFQIGSLYFIVAKASMRSYSWQLSLLRITVLEELVSLLLVEPMQVFALHVLVTSLLYTPLLRASELLSIPSDNVKNTNDMVKEDISRQAKYTRSEEASVLPGLASRKVWFQKRLVWLLAQCHPIVIRTTLYILCLLGVAVILYLYYSVSFIGSTIMVVILCFLFLVAVGTYSWMKYTEFTNEKETIVIPSSDAPMQIFSSKELEDTSGLPWSLNSSWSFHSNELSYETENGDNRLDEHDFHYEEEEEDGDSNPTYYSLSGSWSLDNDSGDLTL